MSEISEAALAYAAKGWKVFPVPPGTKKSYKAAARSGGRKWGATTDPVEIRRDWGRRPHANIGLVCGVDTGFWVLDVDTKQGHGVDGLAALAALEAKHGKLPLTRMAVSPSGSLHYYWLWPLEFPIASRNGKIAPGLDVKANGGFVVAPPSLKDGVAYRWYNDAPMVHAPSWLTTLARAPTRPEPKVKAADTQQVPDYLDDETDAGMAAYEQRERLDDATAIVEELEALEPTLEGARIPYDLYFRLVAAVRNDVGIAGYPLVVRMSQARSHNGTRAGQSAEQIAKAAWRDCEAIKDVHLGSVIYLMKELDDDGDPEEDDDDN